MLDFSVLITTAISYNFMFFNFLTNSTVVNIQQFWVIQYKTIPM